MYLYTKKIDAFVLNIVFFFEIFSYYFFNLTSSIFVLDISYIFLKFLLGLSLFSFKHFCFTIIIILESLSEKYFISFISFFISLILLDLGFLFFFFKTEFLYYLVYLIDFFVPSFIKLNIF